MSNVIGGNTPQKGNQPQQPPQLTPLQQLLDKKQKNVIILEKQVEDLLKHLNTIMVTYEQILQLKDREIATAKKPVESDVKKKEETSKNNK